MIDTLPCQVDIAARQRKGAQHTAADRAERDILADVLVAVTALPGAFFVRMNTGTARTDTGRVVRFGRPGQPDIVGCLRGRYVNVETKTQRGRQSQDQKIWQTACETAGGLYVLARSAEEALARLAVIP